jgi:ketosteroid isomerase-like protein
MSENSEALQGGYDAFNNGDIDTVRELFDEDVRWEGVNTSDLPMSGVHEGRDAVLRALGQIGEVFERYQVSPDEMVEQGDTIVCLSHIDAKTKSGNDLKLPSVEIWRMSGGKVKRAQSLFDTAEMKKAIG